MNKQSKIFALIMLLAFITGTAYMCLQGEKLSLEDKQRVKTRFDQYINYRGFSGAVYAVYKGGAVYDDGAGMATDTIENGSDIAYGVASLTKQITAAAIMQLSEQGKLSVDDKLGKYFPEYRYGDKITLRQLLSQRSGIPDYSVDTVKDQIVVSCFKDDSKGVNISADSSAQENRKKIREYFLSKKLLFEPGSEFDYSDSNFALLAEIVAQVGGMSFHDYVRQNIFEPLGMEKTDFIDEYDPEVITEVAQTDRKEFSIDYFTVKGAEYGCGDMLTTPKDLYRWYKGFTSGKVVNSDSYREMTENYSEKGELGYGYGLMISDESDSKTVYHYGYIPSYYSSMIYVPGIDYFQVVLSNHGAGNPHRLAADLAEYFGSVIDFKFVDIE